MNSALSAFLLAAKMAAGAIVACVAFGGIAAADPAGDTTDPVTGYRCVNQGCMTVRLPDADCICMKRNPGETDVRQVVLACFTKQGGHWTACPVKPRYGITER
jgi:hypothetical protein